MQATINFINGDTIVVEKSGDCYITATKPEFPEVLGRIDIISDEGTKQFEDAQLIECASIDGRYWFAFMETPEDEKLKKRVEELENTNSMLEECILEMSEIIYA